jgi:hypothetical protein
MSPPQLSPPLPLPLVLTPPSPVGLRLLSIACAAPSNRLIPRRYPVSMSEKPQPAPPADDDEARFDDEGSAVGHSEPDETEQRKQKDEDRARNPVTKRDEF